MLRAFSEPRPTLNIVFKYYILALLKRPKYGVFFGRIWLRIGWVLLLSSQKAQMKCTPAIPSTWPSVTIQLSLHPSIYPPSFIHPPMHPPIHPSIHSFTHPSIHPSIHPLIPPSPYPSIPLSTHPHIHQSIPQKARRRCTPVILSTWLPSDMPRRTNGRMTRT